MKRKSKLVRVDGIWEDEMRKMNKQRFEKGLIKFNQKELGLPRATIRLLRCPSWGKIKLEYLNLPEREDDK